MSHAIINHSYTMEHLKAPKSVQRVYGMIIVHSISTIQPTSTGSEAPPLSSFLGCFTAQLPESSNKLVNGSQRHFTELYQEGGNHSKCQITDLWSDVLGTSNLWLGFDGRGHFMELGNF